MTRYSSILVVTLAAAGCSDEPASNPPYGQCVDAACGNPFGPILTVAGMAAKYPAISGTFGENNVPAAIAALAAAKVLEAQQPPGVEKRSVAQAYDLEVGHDVSNCSHTDVVRTDEGPGVRTQCACSGGGSVTAEYIERTHPNPVYVHVPGPLISRVQFESCTTAGVSLTGVRGSVSLARSGSPLRGYYCNVAESYPIGAPSSIQWDFLTDDGDPFSDAPGSLALWYIVAVADGHIAVSGAKFNTDEKTGTFTVYAKNGNWSCDIEYQSGKCTNQGLADGRAQPSFPVTVAPLAAAPTDGGAASPGADAAPSRDGGALP